MILRIVWDLYFLCRDFVILLVCLQVVVLTQTTEPLKALIMLCFVWYVMVCYAMVCYVLLCFVMLWYVMVCYVLLWYVMLCYVTLCYARLCYVTSCYTMFF